jgi:hypothetical protein
MVCDGPVGVPATVWPAIPGPDDDDDDDDECAADGGMSHRQKKN